MTAADAISYLRQLLESCFGAFQLEIWGIPIWIYLAGFMFMSVSVAFLRWVLIPYAGDSLASDKPDRFYEVFHRKGR